jgi:hypothetical protein
MGRSAILLGKGPSILRTTSEYVSSFDDVIIINRPIWDGYENHIPRRADIQYRNNSTEDFSKEEVVELGLRKVVSIAQVGEQLREEAHRGIIDVEYPPFQPGPNNSITLNYKDISFSPSGGVLAFHHIVESGEYDNISVVGLDLMMVGKRAYYFEPEEMQDNVKYLLHNGTYSREGFLTIKKSLHSEENAINYMTGVIEETTDIRFEITSDNEKLIGFIKDFSNTTIL